MLSTSFPSLRMQSILPNVSREQNTRLKSSKYSLFDPCTEITCMQLGAEQRTKGKAAADNIGNPLGKSGGSFIQHGRLAAQPCLPQVISRDCLVQNMWQRKDVKVYSSGATKTHQPQLIFQWAYTWLAMSFSNYYNRNTCCTCSPKKQRRPSAAARTPRTLFRSFPPVLDSPASPTVRALLPVSSSPTNFRLFSPPGANRVSGIVACFCALASMVGIIVLGSSAPIL